MSKKKKINKNNDISADELIELLQDDGDDYGNFDDIVIPEIKEQSTTAKEDLFKNKKRSNKPSFGKKTSKIADTLTMDIVTEEIPEPVIEEPVIVEPVVEEPVIEEPVIEEPVIEEPVIEEPVIEEPVIEEPVIEEPVIEEPVVEEPVIEEPVVEEPVVEEKKNSTKEFDTVTDEADTSDEDSPEVDIDALMKKYLSEAEYEEVMRNRKEAPESDLALHISEAEEYVSSIENQMTKEGPAVPATETQRALQIMDIPHMTQDDDVLDETDINLMLAFGMEEELEEKLGEENAQVLEEAVEKDAELFSNIKREEESLDEMDRNIEFTHSSQIKDVFNIYKRQYRNTLIRIFIGIAALICVFIFDNFTALGGHYPKWMDPQTYPKVCSMASLQLLTLSCALVISPIFNGIKGIFTGKPTSDSILSMAVFTSIIYHIALCFMYDGGAMVFCNTPVVLFIMFTLFSKLIMLKKEIYSFNIISSKRVKYIISTVPAEQTDMEHAAFDEYIEEDSSVFRVSKTGFVDGFFRRTREYAKNQTVFNVIIPLCLLISVFFLLYSGVVKGDWTGGLRIAYIASVLCAPLTAFVIFSYPNYRASKTAFEMGSAIVGEATAENYSNAGAISFDDKDVFPSAKAKVKSIKVYGNNRIDRIIYNVASLFKVVGGPLCDVFNIATKEFECSDDVEIMDISEDGIEAVISGKHIFYGKASYLLKNNFEPVYERDDEKVEFKGEACISYLVCNDEVAAKLYIKYGIDPDFVDISKQLYRSGMCIGIKSFDPNIDDSLIGKYINLSRYAVKVLKCQYLTEKTVTEERSDSGIVSKKNPKSLLRTLAICDKVISVSRTGLVIKALAILAGFGISAFLMFKGIDSFRFASLYTALYQLFWLIPVMGISIFNVKK